MEETTRQLFPDNEPNEGEKTVQTNPRVARNGDQAWGENGGIHAQTTPAGQDYLSTALNGNELILNQLGPTHNAQGNALTNGQNSSPNARRTPSGWANPYGGHMSGAH